MLIAAWLLFLSISVIVSVVVDGYLFCGETFPKWNCLKVLPALPYLRLFLFLVLWIMVVSPIRSPIFSGDWIFMPASLRAWTHTTWSGWHSSLISGIYSYFMFVFFCYLFVKISWEFEQRILIGYLLGRRFGGFIVRLPVRRVMVQRLMVTIFPWKPSSSCHWTFA